MKNKIDRETVIGVAQPVAWQPLETAPDGVRVLLGPRNAPVVGVVKHMPDWADERDPIAHVVHYNGQMLVSNYRCSEWMPLPDAAPQPVGREGWKMVPLEPTEAASRAGMQLPMTDEQILDCKRLADNYAGACAGCDPGDFATKERNELFAAIDNLAHGISNKESSNAE